jgi:TetR/AcrR family transcriptional regulator, regulator of autoinduction and epiphytic fitness
MGILNKLSFKDQAFQLREDSILDATTRILAGKGFDLMTMDDVAAETGISKPSLYKHFKSKEDLVSATMLRLLEGALDFLGKLPGDLSPLDRLKALLEWALQVKLRGGLPFLPAASPAVREMLTRQLGYVARVYALNQQLSQVVQAAKAQGQLRADLPDEVILFSFYARTCDPAVDYLQLYARLDNEAIVAHMLSVCFDGLRPDSRGTTI